MHGNWEFVKALWL